LEKFIKDNKAEIEQKILNCKHPLSIEDLAALAWEYMEQKYPAETTKIDMFEANNALTFVVSELIGNDKLDLHDYVPDHENDILIARYKTAEIQKE